MDERRKSAAIFTVRVEPPDLEEGVPSEAEGTLDPETDRSWLSETPILVRGPAQLGMADRSRSSPSTVWASPPPRAPCRLPERDARPWLFDGADTPAAALDDDPPTEVVSAKAEDPTQESRPSDDDAVTMLLDALTEHPADDRPETPALEAHPPEAPAAEAPAAEAPAAEAPAAGAAFPPPTSTGRTSPEPPRAGLVLAVLATGAALLAGGVIVLWTNPHGDNPTEPVLGPADSVSQVTPPLAPPDQAESSPAAAPAAPPSTIVALDGALTLSLVDDGPERAFYIARTELSSVQYASLMGNDPGAGCFKVGKRRDRSPDEPAMCVSWRDAVSFANALSEAENLQPVYQIDGRAVSWDQAANGYRLATEAEWERAARAGSAATHSGPGEAEPCMIANTDGCAITDTLRNVTLPVDQGTPNAYGLLHMSGNAWEWVWDPWRPEGSKYRTLKGGSFLGSHDEAAISNREPGHPADRRLYAGIRLARNATVVSP